MWHARGYPERQCGLKVSGPYDPGAKFQTLIATLVFHHAGEYFYQEIHGSCKAIK